MARPVCSVSLELTEDSASLTNVGSLAVGAIDPFKCSLSAVRFVLVFHVDSKCRNVVVGLWATQML